MNILQRFFSRRFSQKNKTFIIPMLAVLLCISFCAALLYGASDISIKEAAKSLALRDFGNTSLRILIYLRLPRALAALLTGAALAVSGCIIQAVLNNAMASPNIIGVNSGAGLAVSLMVAIFPYNAELLPLGAFAGALFACLLIYAISVKANSGRITITLIGITVSSILSAGINAVKSIFPDSIYNANAFMVGGLSSVSYRLLSPAWILISGAVIVSFFFAKDIDLLTLGEDTASSLGLNVKVSRGLFLVLASVLAGCAVSIAGLLGFVGLLGAHIARYLVGSSHRYLIPVGAMTGSILVLASDLLGRVLFAPYEIPAGIILSFVGGPFFILLILMQRRSRVYD